MKKNIYLCRWKLLIMYRLMYILKTNNVVKQGMLFDWFPIFLYGRDPSVNDY
jgi:hypothetical protein